MYLQNFYLPSERNTKWNSSYIHSKLILRGKHTQEIRTDNIPG